MKGTPFTERRGLVFSTRSRRNGGRNRADLLLGADQLGRVGHQLASLEWNLIYDLDGGLWIPQENDALPTTSKRAFGDDDRANLERRLSQRQDSDAAERIHSALDAVQQSTTSGYRLLDVVWFTDVDDVGDLDQRDGPPPALYGALLRSWEWYGASVTAVVMSSDDDGLGTAAGSLAWVQDDLFGRVLNLADFLKDDRPRGRLFPDDEVVVWRGGLGFYDEEASRHEYLQGFELLSAPHRDGRDVAALFDDGSRFEDDDAEGTRTTTLTAPRTMRVVTRCQLSSVPPHILTDHRFRLRTMGDRPNELSEAFFSDEAVFGGNNGVVVRMVFFRRPQQQQQPQGGVVDPGLNAETWKKSIMDRGVDGRQHVREFIENQEAGGLKSSLGNSRSAAAVAAELGQDDAAVRFLLLFSTAMVGGGGRQGDRWSLEKAAVLLDPHQELGAICHSFGPLHDALYFGSLLEDPQSGSSPNPEQPLLTLHSASIQIHDAVQRLQASLAGSRGLDRCRSWMPEGDGAAGDDPAIREAAAVQSWFLRRVLGDANLKELRSKSKFGATSKGLQNEDNGDEVDLEEKRFLVFNDMLKRLRATSSATAAGTDSTMATLKPTGTNYVVLEAGEMLKLFTAEGSARYPENCRPITAAADKGHPDAASSRRTVGGGEAAEQQRRKQCLAGWPDVLLTDHHGMHYNRGEKCEELDRERSMIQLMYVGSKETASTCNAQNVANGPAPVVITSQPSEAKRVPTNINDEGEGRPSSDETGAAAAGTGRKVPSDGPGSCKSSASGAPALRRSPRKRVSLGLLPPPPVPMPSRRSTPLTTRGNDGNRGTRRWNQSGGGAAATTSGRGSSPMQQHPSGIASSSSSKMSSSKSDLNPAAAATGGEVFKRKLRNAVYDALQVRRVGEDDPLFRPCFKKLFGICRMYAGEAAGLRSNSTSQWLRKVAEQNADSVINLEKCKDEMMMTR